LPCRTAELGRPRDRDRAEDGGGRDEECEEGEVRLVHATDARRRLVRPGRAVDEASDKPQ
jgi:hypothetical protein